jgi:hypothetical protein
MHHGQAKSLQNRGLFQGITLSPRHRLGAREGSSALGTFKDQDWVGIRAGAVAKPALSMVEIVVIIVIAPRRHLGRAL